MPTAPTRVIPAGYTTVTPWIIGHDTAGLIDWLAAAFGAEELNRLTDEHSVIGHAEVRIGDAVVMMFAAPPDPAEGRRDQGGDGALRCPVREIISARLSSSDTS